MPEQGPGPEPSFDFKKAELDLLGTESEDGSPEELDETEARNLGRLAANRLEVALEDNPYVEDESDEASRILGLDLSSDTSPGLFTSRSMQRYEEVSMQITKWADDSSAPSIWILAAAKDGVVTEIGYSVGEIPGISVKDEQTDRYLITNKPISSDEGAELLDFVQMAEKSAQSSRPSQ